MADAVALIQATLAPIFLVSGAAIFLNFTQARLFRVIDRMRALAEEIEAGRKDPEELRRERARNVRRAVLLRNAILFGVLVIAFTVATTLLILLPGQVGREDLAGLAIGAFTGALVSFAVALLLVTIDAFLSVASAREGFRAFMPGRA